MTPAPPPAPLATEPYPGLRPFRSEEADIFFGREEQTDALLEKLQRSRFLAVVGPSGCGKSSLVKAGLIAALETGFLAEAGSTWRIADMRPGNHPMRRLAQALLEPGALGPELGAQPDAEAFVLAELRRGPLGLAQVVADARLPARTSLLVLVDQFEELFRYRRAGSEDEADAFVALMLAASKREGLPIYVALTMRSDFLGDCALFRGLPEAISESQYLTPRLARDQLESAIAAPARVFGARVDPGLVNHLANEIGPEPDSLPLLQHCLMRMWHHAGERSGRAGSTGALALTREDYKDVGGLAEALSLHADAIYSGLPDSRRRIAEALFRLLGERERGRRDLRRPARLREAVDVAEAPEGEVRAVVEAFRAPGSNFLTPDPRIALDMDTIIDLSHEALIRQWGRLNEWAEREARSAGVYRRLLQTAHLWERKEADLWTGRDLERALQWQDEDRPSAAWARRYAAEADFELAMRFLRESSAEAARKVEERRHFARLKWIAGGLTVLALVASVGMGIYLKKEGDTRRINEELEGKNSALEDANAKLQAAQDALATQKRLSDSRRLAATALNVVADDPELGALLALEGHRLHPSEESESVLRRTLAAVIGQETRLAGHSKAVSDAVFSPDGRLVATAGYDGSARLWDAATGTLRAELKGHRGDVYRALFDPAGRRVVTAGEDGTARVWSVQDGKLLATLEGHKGIVWRAVFSPDGERIVTASRDRTARVWRAADAGELVQLRGHGGEVLGAVFSPDGTRVLTGCADGRARLFDAASGELLRTFARHADGALALFDVSGQRIATLGRDGVARIWSADPGKPPVTLSGHTRNINAATFSPGGDLIATAGSDDTVRIWSTDSGDQIAVLREHGDVVWSVSFSPDARTLVSAGRDGYAIVWDVATRHKLRQFRHDKALNSAAFGPDGRAVVTASVDGSAAVWRIASGRPLREIVSVGAKLSAAATAPDDVRVLAAHEDGRVRVLDARTGVQMLRAAFDGAKVTHAALGSNGETLALGRADGTVVLSDLTEATRHRTLRGFHSARVEHVAFGPDGRLGASADAGGGVAIWRTEDGSLLRRLEPGHGAAVNAVRFDPSGTRLLTGSDDNTAAIWEVDRGARLAVLRGHTRPVLSVAFDPSGRRVLSGGRDHNAYIWDLGSGRPVVTMRGHTASVTQVSYDPRGSIVLSAGNDGTARLWDAATGAPLARFEEQRGERIVSAGFVEDGRTVMTATESGTIRLYPCELCGSGEELARLVDDRVGRALTDYERRVHVGTESARGE